MRSSELIFLSRFLRDPLTIGALVPSSRALATAMALSVAGEGSGTVVELGGGTGTVTQALLDTGLDPGRLVVLERDRHLHAYLAERFPQVTVVHGDARDVARLVNGIGIASAVAVVSSLPFLSIPTEVQKPILEQSFSLLGQRGGFVQFTYGPTSPVPQTLLDELGLRGRRIERVWLNLPPAMVWRFTERPAADESEQVSAA